MKNHWLKIVLVIVAIIYCVYACGFLFNISSVKGATYTPFPVATVADVSGTGSAVALATSGGARWVQIIASTSNASLVRVGDANTACGAMGTGQGLPISAGGGLLIPGSPNSVFSLSSVYACAASGDKFAWVSGQ